MSTLSIQGLRVEVAGKEVLKGFDLTMSSGEVHVIMGPNGSGKSTLAHALAGHPGYKVLGGSVLLDGVELLDLSANEPATDSSWRYNIRWRFPGFAQLTCWWRREPHARGSLSA